MKTDLLIVNGPNLNMLGRRAPEIYGADTLDDIQAACTALCDELGLSMRWFQSNIEGEMVTAIQEAAFDNSTHPASGLIINAAAYSHTSVALYDAVELFEGPSIEVHLSNTIAREDFRHHSYMSLVCDGIIQGFSRDSYLLAIRGVSGKLAAKRQRLITT